MTHGSARDYAEQLLDIWKNQWWLKHDWRSQIRLTDDELQARINLLKSIFDQKWVQSLGDDPMRHPFLQNLLLGEGVSQVRHILELADQIETLRDLNGFHGVLKKYRSLQHPMSAHLEMFMGGVLKRAGYGVEFIVPCHKKGKTPDILVTAKSGRAFSIECKYLIDANAERWIRRYQDRFFSELQRAVPDGIALYYWHYSDLEIREYGHPDNLAVPEIAAIIDVMPIVRAIEGLLIRNVIPGAAEVAGKGALGVFYEDEQMRSRLHAPDLNRRQLIHKLFGGGIQTAARQIREHGVPGIAAIFQSQPASFAAIESWFKKLVENDRELYEGLMGILVFPAQNILHYVRPLWIANPYGELNPASVDIPKVFSEFFDI